MQDMQERIDSMRRVFLSAALAGSFLCTVPAAAQTPAAPASRPTATTTSSTNGLGLFVGGTVGVASVQNVGGLVGGELGIRLSDKLDIFGEGVWMQDVVTRRRLDAANPVIAYLESSQGKSATGTVTAPGSYGGASVRLMLPMTGQIRPYVVFGVGGAHIAFKPSFTLAGSDITSALPQYGVTIGSDLTGQVTKPALTGGAGVRFALGRWYVDGAFRVISIRTSDQPTNVLRASASVGLKF